MQNFEQLILELNAGYIFEFMYMKKQHKISSFDKENYVVYRYTMDKDIKREERMIIGKRIVKEMWNGMTEIIYSY